jgi:glycosyltransferase involved in cell wall biosynthesis
MWWKSRIEKEVDAYIVKYQMDKYIYRSPFRTDVPDLLNSINVYCLPSLWEGLSIALLEAMAMGKAIVATPTDGTKEVIVHEKNGLVIPYEQPQALADAICRFCNDMAFYQQCGIEANRVVALRFNAQRVADAVCLLYNNLV